MSFHVSCNLGGLISLFDHVQDRGTNTGKKKSVAGKMTQLAKHNLI